MPRVRQTRLNFTPVVSPSSPGAQHSSAVATERRATVRYGLTPSSPLASKTSKLESIYIELDSSSDDVELPSRKIQKSIRSDAQQRRSIKGEKSSDDNNSSRSDKAADDVAHPNEIASAESEESSNDPLTTSKKVHGFWVSSESEMDDEQEVRAPNSNRRSRKRAVTMSETSENTDSDDVIGPSPTKRTRHEEATPVRQRGRDAEQEMRDLEEDLDDLRESATINRRTRGRAAESSTKLKRKEHLEALRRRRAGEKSPEQSADEQPETDSLVDEDDLQELHSSSSEEDLPEEDSDEEPPVPEDLDTYDEDFVLQDDDATIGAPAELVELPFEFSRHRYKRLKDHFRDVIEWMVHNKLNPAFPREDPVYRVAFEKVNDEVMGVAGSQLISSVWTRDFKRALEARPGMEATITIDWPNHCDACNRTKHPGRFMIRFTGKPYLMETLEPAYDEEDSLTNVDEDDDNEDSEEAGAIDRNNVDREGRRIPDESHCFYVGSHCKDQASKAHTLIHWRYHLNEWVVDYLGRMDVFTDEKVLERSHWSVKKRTRYANGVVDEMKIKETDRLWRDFNLNLKTARDSGV